MFYESNTKSVFVDFLVIYFMFLYTYYTNMKFINQKLNKKMILVAIQILFLTLICIILDNILGYLYSVMIRVLLLSYLFNKTSSINLSKSVVITVLSTSINYIMYIFSMLLSFVFFNFTGIQNEYINIIIMLTFYTAIVLLILRVKKLKNGISFLYKKIENDFLVMVILNISVIGVKPETILHALEEDEIYISTQSACATSNISKAIKTLTNDDQRAKSSLRISISKKTTEDEINLFLQSFNKNYQRLVVKK